jgi:hypothetical protein
MTSRGTVRQLMRRRSRKTVDLVADSLVARRLADERAAAYTATLLPDKNKNAGQQSENSHDDSVNDDPVEDRRDPIKDEKNREQKQSDVFGEVHLPSILMTC